MDIKVIPWSAILTIVILLIYGHPAMSANNPCPDESSIDYYFPDRPFLSGFGNTGVEAYVRLQYSQILLAAGEPSLSCGRAIAEVNYRFMWVPSFEDDLPLIIRIRYSQQQAYISAIELKLSGPVGSRLTISRRSSRPLKAEEWIQVNRLMEQVWKLEPEQKERYSDGSSWIVEAEAGRSYKVIERQSPEAGLVREIGESFIKLSGFGIAVENVY